MEKKKLHSRYLFAIYIVIALTSVICLIIAVRSDGLLQTVLINLATELAGVVVVFFLVNRFFLLDQWEISGRLDRLLGRLEDAPSANTFFRKSIPLNLEIRDAMSIDWCGVSLQEEIHTNRALLKERLSEGCHIRMLLANPVSDALEMSRLRSSDVRPDHYDKKVEGALADMELLMQHTQTDTVKGTLKVKLVSYAPSFGLFSFDSARDRASLHVEIYGHEDGFGSFPVFALQRVRDQQWYTFFQDQFESMWNNAADWQPTRVKTE